jgi:hypothetical protein
MYILLTLLNRTPSQSKRRKDLPRHGPVLPRMALAPLRDAPPQAGRTCRHLAAADRPLVLTTARAALRKRLFAPAAYKAVARRTITGLHPDVLTPADLEGTRSLRLPIQTNL